LFLELENETRVGIGGANLETLAESKFAKTSAEVGCREPVDTKVVGKQYLD
jgi:hypothetical protein